MISVGVGGSALNSWLPFQKNYLRLQSAIKTVHHTGIRAILWHQGESDSIAGTLAHHYVEMLRLIATQLQQNITFPIKWVIAKAAFHTQPSPAAIAEVIKGQELVVDNQNFFQGPSTEDLRGPEWRNAADLVHFNEKGLREHGKRWAERLIALFFT